MAGPLKNPMHERMCHEMAKGALQYDAYVKAGGKGGKPAASRIANRPDVQARLAELLERGAKRAEVTVADIAKQLDEDREFAREMESAAAAVSATMGKAKVLGLIRERHEHAGPNGGSIPVDLNITINWVDPPEAEG